MYKIYQGVIKSVDKVKRNDNITTYTIHNVRDSVTNQMPNKIFHNIAHGYTNDPDNNDTIYADGTLVFFISDDRAMSDGVILSALQHNPGSRLQLPKSIIGEDYSELFETSEPFLTKKDIVFKKLQGLILLAYTGMIKLRSKFGLEILMNPVIDKMTVLAKKLKFQFHGLEHNVLEIGFQNEDKGLTNINLGFVTDTTGEDPTSSLINVKLGMHKDPNTRATISITDTNTAVLKQNLTISKDGSVELFLKDLTIKVSDQAIVKFDSDGKAYIQTNEFYLGKGTVDQPFIRGTVFKENYDELLDLVKHHGHLVIQGRALPSGSLQGLAAKKLQEDKELSKTNKLD